MKWLNSGLIKPARDTSEEPAIGFCFLTKKNYFPTSIEELWDILHLKLRKVLQLETCNLLPVITFITSTEKTLKICFNKWQTHQYHVQDYELC